MHYKKGVEERKEIKNVEEDAANLKGPENFVVDNNYSKSFGWISSSTRSYEW